MSATSRDRTSGFPESLRQYPRAATLFIGGTALLGFFHLMVYFSEFVQLNFYILVWWSFIIGLEGWNGLRGRPVFLGKSWSRFFRVCGVSVILWFLFEFYNFWLGNWYYVGVPDNPYIKWFNTVIAFATVLPGMWVIKRAISDLLPDSLAHKAGWKAPTGFIVFVATVGLVGGIGPFIIPKIALFLIWGGLLSIVELYEYYWGGETTFLEEAEKGDYQNLLAWLLSGVVSGFLWEFWNSFAIAKWIYTVPFLEQWRLFEMPLIGFLGFPPFAVMTWRLFESIDVRYRRQSIGGKVAFWAAAVVFSGGVCWGMAQYTIASTYSELDQFEGWTQSESKLLEKRGATTYFEARRAVDDPAIQQKLDFLSFGGLWDETGNCLWKHGIESVEQIRRTEIDKLEKLIAKCQTGPSSFWSRRILDWQYR